MPRVLHLLDASPEFEPERCSRMLANALGADFAIVQKAIGPGSAYRNTPTAAALRRIQRDFDLVHAFSPAALTTAALGGGGTRLPILFSPPAVICPATVRWLRAISNYRRVHTIAPTATLRRILIEHGIAADRVHLIRPGVDFSQIRSRRDPDLRRKLGFEDSDRIILAVGENTRPAAHTDAAWAAAILHVADPRYKLLLWNRGPQARQIAKLAKRWKLPRLVTLAPRDSSFDIHHSTFSFESLLPVADFFLITARGPVATLPIAIAMAAARPIVSSATYTTGELLEDHHTALMAPPHQPRLLARRILDFEEDSGLAWKLADMARTEAYEYFSKTRFLDQFRAVYRQLAEGAQVEVPAQAPGAGMRFHGRP